jgi:hypothetical protein
LVVAHQTGDSPMLLDKARRLARADSGAEFVVLTPRRPVAITTVLAGETRTATQIAVWRARRTARRLEAAGVKVVSWRLGAFDPLQAIEEELSYGEFKAVIISTLRPGLSSWLHLDLPSKIKARWPTLDVIHAVAPSDFRQGQNHRGGVEAAPGATTSGQGEEAGTPQGRAMKGDR